MNIDLRDNRIGTIDLAEKLRLFGFTSSDARLGREIWEIMEPYAQRIAEAEIDGWYRLLPNAL